MSEYAFLCIEFEDGPRDIIWICSVRKRFMQLCSQILKRAWTIRLLSGPIFYYLQINKFLSCPIQSIDKQIQKLCVE